MSTGISSNMFKIKPDVAGTLTSGGGGTLSSTTTSTDYNTVFNPYSSYVPYSSYPIVEKYDLKVQRVENGWIVEKDNKKYIVVKAEEILQYLQVDTK